MLLDLFIFAHFCDSFALDMVLDPLKSVRVLLLSHALIHPRAELLSLLQSLSQLSMIHMILRSALKNLMMNTQAYTDIYPFVNKANGHINSLQSIARNSRQAPVRVLTFLMWRG